MITVEELGEGTGAVVQNGQHVEVKYSGSFTTGKVFDSGKFGFKVGAGTVIEGFDLGVLGMKVGGKRRVTIPPELGYGPRGSGPIPGNSTLVFELEILSAR